MKYYYEKLLEVLSQIKEYIVENRKKSFGIALLVAGIALSISYPPFAGFLAPSLPAAASAVIAAVLPAAVFAALVGTVNGVRMAFHATTDRFSEKQIKNDKQNNTSPINNTPTDNTSAPDTVTSGHQHFGTPSNTGRDSNKKGSPGSTTPKEELINKPSPTPVP